MVGDPLPDNGGLLTVAEAAAILGVNVFTVRRWIKAGKLEAIRMGEKLLRIRPEAIARFLDSGVTGKEAAAMPEASDSTRQSCHEAARADDRISLVDKTGPEDKPKAAKAETAQRQAKERVRTGAAEDSGSAADGRPASQTQKADGSSADARAGLDAAELAGGLLTAGEAAALAGVQRHTILQARRRGYLAGVKIGNDWKFRRDDIAAYLEKPGRGARKHRPKTE